MAETPTILSYRILAIATDGSIRRWEDVRHEYANWPWPADESARFELLDELVCRPVMGVRIENASVPEVMASRSSVASVFMPEQFMSLGYFESLRKAGLRGDKQASLELVQNAKKLQPIQTREQMCRIIDNAIAHYEKHGYGLDQMRGMWYDEQKRYDPPEEVVELLEQAQQNMLNRMEQNNG